MTAKDYPHRALKKKEIIYKGYITVFAVSRFQSLQSPPSRSACHENFEIHNRRVVNFLARELISGMQKADHSATSTTEAEMLLAQLFGKFYGFKIKSLISLSPTITLSNTMAVLESCPKHNMVAYLEKTDGNAEFHDIIDSYAHFHSSFSPLHITAKVAGKPVSISEASIRRDLLFDDVNGIDPLPNQVIFDAIQLIVGKHFSGKVTPLFASMLVKPTEDEGAPSERPSEAQPTPSPPHSSETPVEPQTDPSLRPSLSTTILDSIPESSW
ncbi:hypothetical protein Tco_0802780 [Tanacetum coccineum]|uniref:Uncharacterized protein n=1 Tax=Tanacetum coccineum TaxID=301880 RepID=A0ABQ5A3D8_9ASTR